MTEWGVPCSDRSVSGEGGAPEPAECRYVAPPGGDADQEGREIHGSRLLPPVCQAGAGHLHPFAGNYSIINTYKVFTLR